MQIIIEGINRTEFCRPKTKDMDRRRFFETRGMLYRAYPDQLTRMRVYKFGKEMGTDEVIFYQENSIHPQIVRGTAVDKDKMLADIDENKIMTSGLTPKKAWGVLSSKTSKGLATYVELGIVGAVLLFAFLSNGSLS